MPKNSPSNEKPVPAFVNLVISVELDKALVESETLEREKFDLDTRLNREKERTNRNDRKQRAIDQMVKDSMVRVSRGRFFLLLPRSVPAVCV